MQGVTPIFVNLSFGIWEGTSDNWEGTSDIWKGVLMQPWQCPIGEYLSRCGQLKLAIYQLLQISLHAGGRWTSNGLGGG